MIFSLIFIFFTTAVFGKKEKEKKEEAKSGINVHFPIMARLNCFIHLVAEELGNVSPAG